MKSQKILGLALGIIFFIALIAGLSYAYTTWNSESMKKIVNTECFELYYDKGTDIYGAIIPSDDYTGGLYVTVKMDINNRCDINAVGKIYLTTSDDTSSNLYRTGLLNYQLVKNGVPTDIKGNITSSGVIELDLGYLNKNTTAKTEYIVYVWLDNNLIENTDVNSVYFGSIRSEAVQYNDA